MNPDCTRRVVYTKDDGGRWGDIFFGVIDNFLVIAAGGGGDVMPVGNHVYIVMRKIPPCTAAPVLRTTSHSRRPNHPSSSMSASDMGCACHLVNDGVCILSYRNALYPTKNNKRKKISQYTQFNVTTGGIIDGGDQHANKTDTKKYKTRTKSEK